MTDAERVAKAWADLLGVNYANPAQVERFQRLIDAGVITVAPPPDPAEQIAEVNAENPFVGFPYTKLMTASAFVDQSAAFIGPSASTAFSNCAAVVYGRPAVFASRISSRRRSWESSYDR